MKENQKKTDAELMLKEWGKWIRSFQYEHNCSPLYWLMRENVGGVVPDLMIGDDTALRVDALVARLLQINQEEGKAIFYCYGLAMSRHAAAKKMRVSETKLKTVVRSGLNWLDGFLHGLRAA